MQAGSGSFPRGLRDGVWMPNVETKSAAKATFWRSLQKSGATRAALLFQVPPGSTQSFPTEREPDQTHRSGVTLASTSAAINHIAAQKKKRRNKSFPVTIVAFPLAPPHFSPPSTGHLHSRCRARSRWAMAFWSTSCVLGRPLGGAAGWAERRLRPRSLYIPWKHRGERLFTGALRPWSRADTRDFLIGFEHFPSGGADRKGVFLKK